MSFRGHFSRFLEAAPGRLHFAAHSHHPWPDVTLDAQQQAWLDAARHMDAKWGPLLEDVWPRAQGHVARVLGLSRPADLAFAPNTHELLKRIVSAIEGDGPVRVLTTDAEFHSFSRQLARWEEAGQARAVRVPAEPYATFPDRFAEAAAGGAFDLVYFSHVHFDSGYVTPDLARLVGAVSDERTLVCIDGYHSFCALPTDLASIEDRAFFLSGGYKYAMAGEGCCFAHCPPGYAERPVDTGWFASFGTLADGAEGEAIPYAVDGFRLAGATIDPTALYRLIAVQDWMLDRGLTIDAIHAHVRGLQDRFLAALAERDHPEVHAGNLVPGPDAPDRGHFLTFRTPAAGELQAELASRGVVTDHRGDRLRFGFGIYHDDADVQELLARLFAS